MTMTRDRASRRERGGRRDHGRCDRDRDGSRRVRDDRRPLGGTPEEDRDAGEEEQGPREPYGVFRASHVNVWVAVLPWARSSLCRSTSKR
jgi:hypothetical protein